MPLTDGIVDTSLIQAAAEAAHLGVITDYVGLARKETRFMTIGAQDVHAFVGLNGPDWVDADGDGEIDRDSDGQIIDAEVNHDAVGLVLDDVDFALALMTPLNPIDPTRYVAFKASAAKVALVGIDGLVATAKNLIVAAQHLDAHAVRPAPATRRRLRPVEHRQPGRPVRGEGGGLPRSFGGDPVVVPFTFDSALIRASGQFNVKCSGSSRSAAASRSTSARRSTPRWPTPDTRWSQRRHHDHRRVEPAGLRRLCPDKAGVELNTDGSVHWVDADGNDATRASPSMRDVQNPNAIGLLINDLDFGIFVGVKTPSATDVTAGVFVATNIVVDSFGLIGVPGITALGTLAI